MSPTKKNGRRRNKSGKSANSSEKSTPPTDALTAAALCANSKSYDKPSENNRDGEAFLRACFPGLPIARLKSAVGRCDGDMERIMDWLLGELHENEGELQYALRLSPDTPSTSSSEDSPRQAYNISSNLATKSENGLSIDSLTGSEQASYPASTITATSNASGNSSSTPSAKSSNSSRRKNKTSRALHIDEFLASRNVTSSGSTAWPDSSDDYSYTDATTNSNRNCWSEIERMTHHLAVIFPQISRDVIKSTLHTNRLDVEATVAQLADPSTQAALSTPIASPTRSNARGLARWRPDNNKSSAKTQKSTVQEPEDEATKLDAALCQLTTILPSHDVDTLVEALIHCNLKVDAAINHLLTAGANNSKVKPMIQNRPINPPRSKQKPPTPSIGVSNQKTTQQQQDFWAAHRFQREANPTFVRKATVTTTSFKSTNDKRTLSNPSPWQTIKSNRLANNGSDVDINASSVEDGIEIDNQDPDTCTQYAVNYYEKRNEAFRRAAQAFRGRNRNGAFGGALAAFYASEGRDHDARMREWNTRAAIGVLRSFQKQWRDDYVVDLHYMTVDQALEVALLAVQDWATIERKTAVKSDIRPLRIVTGAGSHSHDGRAKLFPRVQRGLREAGWQVTAIDKGSFMVKNPRPLING
ncbi:hypothetical protein BDF19DRAFT_429768 [Syncephalis fuscata]|nr:hypothetical protein BDF19DRAFT_429768 [Syncephalis fuscata]